MSRLIFIFILLAPYKLLSQSSITQSCSINIPNVFSPNFDGINDSFIAKTECNFSNYTLIIYSRFGVKVFESNSPKQTWDGTSGGEAVSEGIYFYVLSYKTPFNSREIMKGSVSLLR